MRTLSELERNGLQPNITRRNEMTQTNAKPERKETYSVVVESGSCSQVYRRWEERANCGHAHKTIETANACMAKLTRRYCNHGRVAGTTCGACCGYARRNSTSARWYNATIHNQNQERVNA